MNAVEFDHDVGQLTVRVESPPEPMGCRSGGVIAHSHDPREVTLVDAPCFDRPVRLIWRKRTWRCVEASCPVGVITEQDEQVARPRALATRACWWAVNQVRRRTDDDASVLESAAGRSKSFEVGGVTTTDRREV